MFKRYSIFAMIAASVVFGSACAWAEASNQSDYQSIKIYSKSLNKFCSTQKWADEYSESLMDMSEAANASKSQKNASIPSSALIKDCRVLRRKINKLIGMPEEASTTETTNDVTGSVSDCCDGDFGRFADKNDERKILIVTDVPEMSSDAYRSFLERRDQMMIDLTYLRLVMDGGCSTKLDAAFYDGVLNNIYLYSAGEGYSNAQWSADTTAADAMLKKHRISCKKAYETINMYARQVAGASRYVN